METSAGHPHAGSSSTPAQANTTLRIATHRTSRTPNRTTHRRRIDEVFRPRADELAHHRLWLGRTATRRACLHRRGPTRQPHVPASPARCRGNEQGSSNHGRYLWYWVRCLAAHDAFGFLEHDAVALGFILQRRGLALARWLGCCIHPGI